MVLIKKTFFFKVLLVLSVFNKALGSFKGSKNVSRSSQAKSGIDLQSPVSQRGVEYSLMHADPESPLYQIQKITREFPIVLPTVVAQSPIANKVNKVSRVLSIINPDRYFITAESVRESKRSSQKNFIPKETHWVEQVASDIEAREDAFNIKVEKLGKKDQLLFNGLLYFPSETTEKEHSLSLVTFPESRRIWIGTKNCLMKSNQSIQGANSARQDCSFRNRASLEEIDGCFITICQF